MVDSIQARFCSSCGGELPEEARFCASCGATVTASAAVAPRRRIWVTIAVGVGVVLVAFAIGYGLSLGGDNAPAAAPTELDNTVASSGLGDIATSTFPDLIEPTQPVTSVRTIETFADVGAVLSPDGRLIFYQMPDDRRPEGRMWPWCVRDVETFAESCADVPVGLDSGAAVPVWSQASDRVVWTTSNNTDVFVYDVSTDTIVNLTDDGVDAEGASENLGKGLMDRFPTWVANDEEIVFFRTYSAESLFRFDLHSINLAGSETAHVAAPTYERTFQGNVSLQSRWIPLYFPPLPDGGREVLVAGDGAVFAVDLGRGTTSVVVEYADQYEEEIRGVGDALGVAVRPSLWPIARLTDGRLLLADPLVFSAINQTGHPADATSGAYVLDIASRNLSPLFLQSPSGEYGGPISVALSPDESELLVVWFDSALVHPYREARGQKGRYVVSVLDVDSIDGPIDPRDLPQIYGSASESSLYPISGGFSVEWAENDTVLLSTLSEEGLGTVLIGLNRG